MEDFFFDSQLYNRKKLIIKFNQYKEFFCCKTGVTQLNLKIHVRQFFEKVLMRVETRDF